MEETSFDPNSPFEPRPLNSPPAPPPFPEAPPPPPISEVSSPLPFPEDLGGEEDLRPEPPIPRGPGRAHRFAHRVKEKFKKLAHMH